MARPRLLIVAISMSGAILAAAALIALRYQPATNPSPEVPQRQTEAGSVALEPPVAPSEGAPPASLLEGPPSTPSRQSAVPRFANLLSMPESTRTELEAKAKAISETLPIYTHPAFEARIAAGQVDAAGENIFNEREPPDEQKPAPGTITGPDLTYWTGDQARGIFSVTLSRSEYADLYELHDCLGRLNKQLRALEHRDFMAQREEQNARMRK